MAILIYDRFSKPFLGDKSLIRMLYLFNNISAKSWLFKFPLTSDGCSQNHSNLYESYHGVAVSLGFILIILSGTISL